MNNTKYNSKVHVLNESCYFFNRKENPHKNILIVVDMQNDFVSGVLSNYQTNQVEYDVEKEIISDKYDAVIFTKDIHKDNTYYDTLEGQKLPVKHCIENTVGANLTYKIMSDINLMIEDGDKYIAIIEKDRFCSLELGDFLIDELCVNEEDTITIIGVCTDICVVSNAIYLRAKLPNTEIKVISSCCAGTSIKAHFDSLSVLESCQISVID
jgi:nicotinamidase-related amidase